MVVEKDSTNSAMETVKYDHNCDRHAFVQRLQRPITVMRARTVRHDLRQPIRISPQMALSIPGLQRLAHR